MRGLGAGGFGAESRTTDGPRPDRGDHRERPDRASSGRRNTELCRPGATHRPGRRRSPSTGSRQPRPLPAISKFVARTVATRFFRTTDARFEPYRERSVTGPRLGNPNRRLPVRVRDGRPGRLAAFQFGGWTIGTAMATEPSPLTDRSGLRRWSRRPVRRPVFPTSPDRQLHPGPAHQRPDARSGSRGQDRS